MKKVVRLTESKLREMIKESVMQVLSEGFEDDMAEYLPGQNYIQSDLLKGSLDNDSGARISWEPRSAEEMEELRKNRKKLSYEKKGRR